MRRHRSHPPLNDHCRKLRDPLPRSSRPQIHDTMAITGRSSVLIVLFLILPTGSITTMINDHASCIEIKQRFEGDMMNGASTHHQHIKKPTVTMRLRRGKSATWTYFGALVCGSTPVAASALVVQLLVVTPSIVDGPGRDINVVNGRIHDCVSRSVDRWLGGWDACQRNRPMGKKPQGRNPFFSCSPSLHSQVHLRRLATERTESQRKKAMKKTKIEPQKPQRLLKGSFATYYHPYVPSPAPSKGPTEHTSARNHTSVRLRKDVNAKRMAGI